MIGSAGRHAGHGEDHLHGCYRGKKTIQIGSHLAPATRKCHREKIQVFCPETVGTNTATFARALKKLDKPDDAWLPRQVFLFSGHMIDAPDRATPRFPADKELAAAQKIRATLDSLGAGPDDLALAQGASGGDILFLEACRERGLRLQLLLPLAEPEFIERSILSSTGGAKWRDRYYALKASMRSAPRVIPNEPGSLPKDMDPFERCNLSLLNTALAYSVDKVHFICLWDGGNADGPGGTGRMYDEVKQRTGRVTWIDSRQL